MDVRGFGILFLIVNYNIFNLFFVIKIYNKMKCPYMFVNIIAHI